MKKRYIGTSVILIGLVISSVVLAKAIFFKDSPPSVEGLKEASYYTALENGKVQCQLCPNRCVLQNRQRGICGVRENINGKLYSLVYGKPVAIHVDPIEKKPFNHFLPTTKAFSLATAGCNLDCKYCQNWDIAHRSPEEVESIPMNPEQVVNEAIKAGAKVIAFTYNEPTVWYEYMYDIAKIAKEKKLKTAMISAGYINPEPLKNLLPYLDGARIDLKSFNTEVYQKLIQGKLEPVLDTIKTIHQSNTWLEIIHLVVPGYTDNLKEIEQMCLWIKENVGENVPVHFTRFWPKYKLLNVPPTSEETLKKARETCLRTGIKFVYTGNILDEVGSATFCPETGEVLIERRGYFVEKNLIDKDGKAPNCPSEIPGVWK